MADKRLADYVSRQISAGYSVDDIRRVLIQQGWPEEDIEEALSGYEKPVKPAKTKPAKAGEPVKPVQEEKLPGKGVSMKLIGIIMVIIIVIAAVIAFMVMTWMPPPEPPPEPVCGNDVCETGETYISCPADCQAPPATQALVAVSPPAQTAGVGSNLTVNILVYNSTDMYGFQFNLQYDSGILQFQRAVEGTFLNENGNADTFYLAPASTTAGLLKNAACARKGQIGGVDGDGILVTITFRAIASGTSQLTLSNVQLSNSQVKAIQFTTSNGQVTVQ